MLQRHKLSGLVCALALMAAPSAYADTNAELVQKMQIMQQQMQQMQAQLNVLQKQLAQQTAPPSPAAPVAVAATPAPARTATAPAPGIVITNKNKLRITVGGFTEAAGIFRTRNETADVGTNYSTGMPFPVSPNYHMSELRGSARQSRLSLLAEGDPDNDTQLSAYFEGDFLGAAPTANSTESNSYNPRLRQAYATLDKEPDNFHLLAGQSWSLLTLDKKGITPRQENVPLTIDAQYVPGFTWTRNPQLRLVGTSDDKSVSAGLSLESPEATIGGGLNTPPGTPTFTNTGGSGFAPTSTYSTDIAPDVIAKVAFDPGYGHYEVYGLARFFRDRANKENHTIMGGGGGAAAILPLIDKKLEFQISGLAGTGIGRYGSAQLPDVTFKSDGTIASIREVEALAGVIVHPTEDWDVYFYTGTEREQRQAFESGGLGYGYGSPLYINSGCDIEGSAAGCVANTSSASQIAVGTWWKFYHGTAGTMQTGLENAYTRRDTFSGVGGAPHTDEDVIMLSLRYYPF